MFDFENRIVNGIKFPDSNQNVSGFRVDKPIITAKLIGAPHWVEKSDVDFMFGRWGKVISSIRGTASISSPEGVVSEFGSGWVWNKEWIIKLQIDRTLSIPTCVSYVGWQRRR